MTSSEFAADHYGVLGIAFGATSVEIAAAYRRGLARLQHGLASGEAPGPEALDALRHAYKVLSDPERRQAYDATHPAASRASQDARVAEPHSRPATGGQGLGHASNDAAQSGPQRFDLEFVGSGGEYFRIWIVNLFLSIITLGIYSAWAKVRREQYFHRNLLLDGSGFTYHGQPSAILKGRAVAFVLLMALSVTEKIGPLAHGIALLALIPAVPWLAVRAFRFRAHNTSYRGLHFSFHGTYRQALTTFVGFGLLTLVSLGLLFPMWLQRQKRFVLDNLYYGTAPFACTVGSGAFFTIFLKPLLGGIGVGAALFLLVTLGGPAMSLIVPVLMVGLFLAFQLLFLPYITVSITNLVWNHTKLADHGFSSQLRVLPYFGIVFSNWVAIICTLGLFWPWAKVRLAAYRARNLSLNARGSLDEFVVGESTRASALGDEAADMFDLDVAF
ncbi:hypothetical protein OTERR_19520 [Oryzomicrobium terrae]|uniref:J domain-containing protein n=1 Tax=Oryzomicrobium terrae TaxID=1735038 RepID=A0A5C1EB16_9RHOO|nr:DUF898 family protein [Oryzomicrobium terrae]QEL65428.1 hypothetical protein OTERR_19520 [Oryzomicrobium terrae]